MIEVSFIEILGFIPEPMMTIIYLPMLMDISSLTTQARCVQAGIKTVMADGII